MENRKYLIWDNDTCALHDEILENPDNYDENNEIDDIWAWEYAQAIVEENLSCEAMNLDIDKENNIFLIGTLQRWDGSYGVHMDLETNNIGRAIKEAVSRRNDLDGSCRIYLEKGKLLIACTGHDNPVNPSVMEFRTFKDCEDLDEFEQRFKRSEANLKKHSRSIADDVKRVYGW